MRIVIGDDGSVESSEVIATLAKAGYSASIWEPSALTDALVVREKPTALVLPRIHGGGDAIKLCWQVRTLGLVETCIAIVDRTFSERVARKAFGVGSDDYWVGTLGEISLVERLQVLLVRREILPPPAPEVRLGPVTIDAFDRVRVNGEMARLPDKERTLLRCLGSTPGTVVTSQTLRNVAWDGVRAMPSNSLEVHMSRLRRWIREHVRDGAIQITSIRGVGYSLWLDATPLHHVSHGHESIVQDHDG